MKILRAAFIFMVVFVFGNLYSQSSISGIISDENGAPLPYADIIVIGTNYGSSSNDDGEYSISLPDNFVQGQNSLFEQVGLSTYGFMPSINISLEF